MPLDDAVDKAAEIPPEHLTVEVTKWVRPGNAALSPGMVAGRFTLLVSPADEARVRRQGSVFGWKITPLPKPRPGLRWFRN